MFARRSVLYLIPWLTDIAGVLLIFMISRQQAETGVGPVVMGVYGAVFSLATAASSFTCGRLSDRFGRRRTILAGQLTMLASVALCLGMMPDLSLVAYAMMGAGLGAVHPPLMAILCQGGDSIRDHGGVSRTLVGFCLAWNAGLICGQFGGGWLYPLDPSWPLIAAGIATLADMAVLGIITLWPPPAVAAHSNDRDTDAHRRHQSLSAAFTRLAWLANLGSAFAMSMVINLFPRLMVDMEVPSEKHGAILAISRAVVIAVYFLMHLARFWHHCFRVAVLSQMIAAAGLITIAAAQTPVGVLLGLLGLSQLVGYNYFSSLYYSTSGAHDERKGAASGMHEATLALGFAAGSLFGGLAIAQMQSERAPYLLAALVLAAMLMVQGLVYWRYTRHARHVEAASSSVVTTATHDADAVTNVE